jgi:hypothetical protein
MQTVDVASPAERLVAEMTENVIEGAILHHHDRYGVDLI